VNKSEWKGILQVGAKNAGTNFFKATGMPEKTDIVRLIAGGKSVNEQRSCWRPSRRKNPQIA
jgi:quinol-cytochrome oxidoreductase complex cytochrome b subunit